MTGLRQGAIYAAAMVSQIVGNPSAFRLSQAEAELDAVLDYLVENAIEWHGEDAVLAFITALRDPVTVEPEED